MAREHVAEPGAAHVAHAAQIGAALDARNAHVAEDATTDDLGIDTPDALERRPEADRFFARDVKGGSKRLAPRCVERELVIAARQRSGERAARDEATIDANTGVVLRRLDAHEAR